VERKDGTAETPPRIIVIGAGGHGSEVASYIGDLSASDRALLVGFVDEHRSPGPWRDSEILGDFEALRAFLDARPGSLFHYITAVGTNPVRRRLVRHVERLGAHNLVAWSLRHPTSQVGRDVQIGEGTCLAPGSIVTTSSSIGRHCILNIKSSVSHDCIIGDFTNLNPGVTICGNVEIGVDCYIGAGATVIDKVTIGEGTVVGAGAVVTTDLPAGVTAVGVPARVLERVTIR
jgi:sugar O-acyltransferase (sialic acid O-acetyltransferase NeuD family)